MVMGGDSSSEVPGFESQYRTLDGAFFTFIVVKIVKLVGKRTKIKEKEAGNGPF